MGTFRLQAKLLVRLGLFDFQQARGVDNAKWWRQFPDFLSIRQDVTSFVIDDPMVTE
jgi:hypothetical protein